ncbi:JmjC domain-containing protein [Labedaea rhizosphaerae]|nr:cupin domain-containing protein [Labedaea rhizosphaerae]
MAVPGPDVVDRPALVRCVGPDVDAFASDNWGKAPLLRKATGTFDDLLTLRDIDELLSERGLRTPFLRMARAGQVLDSSQFTSGGGVGAEVGDQVADEKVLRLFGDGATVVLQGLHRVWPSLIEFGTQLGTDLGHPVQINAYVTPASSQGFSAHYDVHDVFVLQVAGEKHWHVHAPVHPDPLRNQPWSGHADAVARRATEPPVIDEVLRPGDVLYLPRGYLHSATALGAVSAHLTVGVHVLTRFAIVEALCAMAASAAELRGTLPLGIDVGDPRQLGPHVEDTIAELARTLKELDPAEVADRLRGRQWSGNRPAPLGPLAQLAAADELGEGSRVRVRSGLRHRLVADGDRARLDLPGDRLWLPSAATEALGVLLSGAVATVGTLPALDLADQLVVVRRLLREGVLVPA